MNKTKISIGKETNNALPKVSGTRPEAKTKLFYSSLAGKIEAAISNSKLEQLKKTLGKTESSSMLTGFQFRKTPLLMEVR
ncbi:hypothetical protein KEJ15_01550 [Candidatus Bathyarchaeota archaeon]|nr:hypothetical protein [Candidatus Bathyarchaeota archaeon]